MDDRTLKVLEYNKIIERLAGYAQSDSGRQLALQLKPSSDKIQIMEWQQETSEAESILAAEGSNLIAPFPDIQHAVRKAKIGSVLSPKELLEVVRVYPWLARSKGAWKSIRIKKSLN